MSRLRACPGEEAPAAGAKAGGGNVRRFDNGFILEDMSMGQPDGKLAKAGSKVRGALHAHAPAAAGLRARAPLLFGLQAGRWLPLDVGGHSGRADYLALTLAMALSPVLMCLMGQGDEIVVLHVSDCCSLLPEACA